MTAKTFQAYMNEKFWYAHPECLDDDYPDHYDDWLDELDPAEVVLWAQEWHDKVMKEAL